MRPQIFVWHRGPSSCFHTSSIHEPLLYSHLASPFPKHYSRYHITATRALQYSPWARHNQICMSIVHPFSSPPPDIPTPPPLPAFFERNYARFLLHLWQHQGGCEKTICFAKFRQITTENLADYLIRVSRNFQNAVSQPPWLPVLYCTLKYR